MVESSKKVRPWRDAIRAACTGHRPAAHACHVSITFFLPRPKAHYGTKNGQPYLRSDSPVYVTSKPDLDKLIRSTLDGLTDAGILADDSYVACLTAQKVYANDPAEVGASITITDA